MKAAQHTQIWSHRGNGLHKAENTLPAFALLNELPIDGVELDVQRSKDGVLVVTHDENLRRVTGLRRSVSELKFSELRSLNAAAYLRSSMKVEIPTLEEVLTVLKDGSLRINLELKNNIIPYPRMEKQVLGLVERMGLQERMLYSSFNHRSIAELRSLGSPSPLALLFQFRRSGFAQYARGKGVAAVHPNQYRLRSEHEVILCHEAGLEVNVWTASRPQDIERCLALGVDALITNDLMLALKIRDETEGLSRAKS